MPLVAAGIGVGVGAPIVGGILGNSAAAGNRTAAGNALGNEQALIGTIPQLNSNYTQPIAIQAYENAPTYTPEMEQQLALGASPYQNISQNQAVQAAQLNALAQLSQQSQTGMSMADQAAQNQILQNANASVQGNEQALRQQFEAQGLGGSGAQLASQLAAAQSGANTANQNSLQVAAQAQNARMNALAQIGQQGNALQNTNLQYQATQAGGLQANQLAQFNANLATQQQNVGAQNQGQVYNIGNQMNQSNANVTANNQNQAATLSREMGAAQYGLGAEQAAAGQESGIASAYGGLANNQAAGYGQMFGGIGQAATSLGAAGINSNATIQAANIKAAGNGQTTEENPEE